jgi:hypothetical protein
VYRAATGRQLSKTEGQNLEPSKTGIQTINTNTTTTTNNNNNNIAKTSKLILTG